MCTVCTCSQHAGIPVDTTEPVIAAALDDINQSLSVIVYAEVKESDIKGAAAKIVDHDLAVLFKLADTVIQRGRRRLVDDVQHVKTGDDTGLLRRGALLVTKIRRAGNDHILNVMPLSVCVSLHTL